MKSRSLSALIFRRFNASTSVTGLSLTNPIFEMSSFGSNTPTQPFSTLSFKALVAFTGPQGFIFLRSNS